MNGIARHVGTSYGVYCATLRGRDILRVLAINEADALAKVKQQLDRPRWRDLYAGWRDAGRDLECLEEPEGAL